MSGDLKPETFALAKHFPTLWSALYLLYIREFEVLYEHDKVSIFGLVSYDTVNDQLCFDKVIGMFQDSKQALIDLLNREWWGTLLSKSFKRAVGIFCIIFLYNGIVAAFLMRRRHLAIQRT